MRRIAALLLVAALAVSGCGSASLTMSQFRSAATRICTTAGVKTDRLRAPSNATSEAAYLRSGARVLQPELVQLRKLSAPPSLADVYAIAVSAFAGKLRVLLTTIQGLDRGADPIASIKALQYRLVSLEAEEDGAWRALGVPVCLNR